MNDLATELKKVAFRERRSDSFGPTFGPYDIGSGNADDTYYGGVSDGEITLARDLLKKFFHWTDEEILAKVEK